ELGVDRRLSAGPRVAVSGRDAQRRAGSHRQDHAGGVSQPPLLRQAAGGSHEEPGSRRTFSTGRSFCRAGCYSLNSQNVRKRPGELRQDVDSEAATAFFLSALTFILLVVELFGGRQVEPLDEERLVRSMSDLFF